VRFAQMCHTPRRCCTARQLGRQWLAAGLQAGHCWSHGTPVLPGAPRGQWPLLGGEQTAGTLLAVLCCAVLCCAVLRCAVLCCAVLCCAVLFCSVLCCAVLRCAVLC
jgi:hypothetical protein